MAIPTQYYGDIFAVGIRSWPVCADQSSGYSVVKSEGAVFKVSAAELSSSEKSRKSCSYIACAHITRRVAQPASSLSPASEEEWLDLGASLDEKFDVMVASPSRMEG